MISRELALALHDAGVRWSPRSGDRFSLIDPNFTGDVFTLAEMTVEPQGPPDQRVLGFNGTTEWALDSVDLIDALWLPREDQLRELLGPFFRRLAVDDDGFTVTVQLPGRAEEDIHSDSAEDAYGLAVLARLAGAASEESTPLDDRLGQ